MTISEGLKNNFEKNRQGPNPELLQTLASLGLDPKFGKKVASMFGEIGANVDEIVSIQNYLKCVDQNILKIIQKNREKSVLKAANDSSY